MGLDQEGQYSTARDLALLAIEALKNPEFAKIVGTSQVEFTDVSGENKYFFKNTNQLVSQESGFRGVKTGWTENAGQCLVTYYDKDSRRIITVVLNSNDRIGETKQFTSWLLDNFIWESVTEKISYR
jgi:D-alanyl-D-alanine carboxypeptidase